MNRRHANFENRKANDFWGTLKRLLNYLKKDKYIVIMAAIFSIITALITVFTPILSGKLLTSIELIWSGKDPLGIIDLFGLKLNFNEVLIGLIMTASLSFLLGLSQGYLLIGVTQRLTFKMRSDLADKINTLPLNFFDKHKTGDILSRVTNDVDTINQTLTQSISEIFRSFTLVASILIIMFIMRWDLALITTVSVVLSFYVASKFVKLSQRYFKQAAKNTGDMSGHIEEVYHGHQVVKVFNHQKQSKDEFDEINNRIYETSWKAQFVSSIMVPIQFLFTNMAFIAVAMIGGYLLMTDPLFEVGFIMTFIMYARQVAQPILSIGQTASVLQQTAASAERIFFIMDAESESDESSIPNKLKTIKGQVEFRNVHFSYIKDTPVIQGLSAVIKPGQMVAIVGPTGAGKTTLVNLLMRFYELDQGSILIDGVDIKDMKREEVRSYFGMVLQDSWIFEGSVLDNIKYGSEDKTLEDVEQAAKAAQTDHFIHSLSDNYNFILSEDGQNISQGQRQLITISRAMLADKPMLILDEATSSVDTRTEILIQKAMDRLMKGRTAFVIAHRLSTIKNADVIFVVKDGNIIEQGDHNTLINKGGFYAQLYNSQFES
ncbi:ABC transporter ATP-binding protein [Acholeplasma granularum]|uniref:ABC transporter ATP-binding protein n=1 Tax=Acholeplasma granularum TaxID=264635 RepID=UPI00046FADA3|nr:ABC transporter ATP-binding protein [Acholeplasma granularum]